MSNFELLYNQFAVMFCWQMAVAARNAEGHGWLRPALGVMELSQSIIQVPLLSVLSSHTVWFLDLKLYSFFWRVRRSVEFWCTTGLANLWMARTVAEKHLLLGTKTQCPHLEFFYVLNNLQLSTNWWFGDPRGAKVLWWGSVPESFSLTPLTLRWIFL
jgi:hypothetical protein